MQLRTVGCLPVLVAIACMGGAPVGPSGKTPAISQVTPVSGPVGTRVTIRGTDFGAADNTVKFGSGYIGHLNSEDQGTTLRFTVPEGLELCPPGGAPCAVGGAFPPVVPGDYDIAVMSGGETSKPIKFTVTKS
jgi:IPT/TIG domain-containing protein